MASKKREPPKNEPDYRPKPWWINRDGARLNILDCDGCFVMLDVRRDLAEEIVAAVNGAAERREP